MGRRKAGSGGDGRPAAGDAAGCCDRMGARWVRSADVRTSVLLHARTHDSLTPELERSGHWVYMVNGDVDRYADDFGKDAFERDLEDWELALRYLLDDGDEGHCARALSGMSEDGVAALYRSEGESPWWYVEPDDGEVTEPCDGGDAVRGGSDRQARRGTAGMPRLTVLG